MCKTFKSLCNNIELLTIHRRKLILNYIHNILYTSTKTLNLKYISWYKYLLVFGFKNSTRYLLYPVKL